MNQVVSSLYQLVINSGTSLLGALFVLIVGLRLIKWGCKLLRNAPFMAKLDSGIRTFADSALSLVLYALLGVIICSILGINTTSFIAIFTSASVALGVALQGALANIAGGLMLLIFRPFKAGDYIEANDLSGSVTSITVLYTFLKTPDNKTVMIPNGTLTAASITNFSRIGTRRVDIKFNVSYNSDIELVKETLLRLANDHKLVQNDPAPFARMTGQGDSALEFTMRVWCLSENYWTVYFDLLENTKKEFDRIGILIPYPQMDVHIDTTNSEKGE